MSNSGQNYFRMRCEFIPEATDIVRKIFYNTWKQSNGNEWSNTESEGLKFINGRIGDYAWVSGTRRQKELMGRGDAEMWDMKLLTHILTKVDFGSEKNLKAKSKLELRELNDILNDVRINYDCSISDEEFETVSKRAKQLLTNLQNLVRDYREDVEISRANAERAQKLRNDGNSHFGSERYTEAISVYDEAIELQFLPKEDLGKLYCNRSAAHLSIDRSELETFQSKIVQQYQTEGQMSELEVAERYQYHVDKICEESRDLTSRKNALSDAKAAVHLCPLWFRAHCSLGNVYLAMKKYIKATYCFDLALMLDETREEIKRLRAESVENVKGCEDHWEGYDVMGDITELTKDNPTDPCALLLPGLRFLQEKSFEKAFACFWELEGGDIALPLHHLGELYLNGLGTAKDVKLAYEMFLKAAQKPWMPRGNNNPGIECAEYELGRMYEKGIGVSADLGAAIYWYERSSEHGGTYAPVRLGSFYMNGRGVEANEEEGIRYYEMVAEKDCGVAAKLLANHYLQKQQRDLSLSWLDKSLEIARQARANLGLE